MNPALRTTGYSAEEANRQQSPHTSFVRYPRKQIRTLETVLSGDMVRGIVNMKKNGELYWESAEITRS